MKVVVGISGGIDSAVAYALLVEQGHEVIGVHLSFHCSDNGSERARQVALKLDLPYQEVGVSEEFEKEVLDLFTDEWSKAILPTPA